MNRLLVFFCSLFLFLSLAQPMNSAINLEALVKRQAQAWEDRDITTLIADFAPDAVFIATGYVFEGKEAIAKAAADYFRDFTDTKVKIERIIVRGNQGAVEWKWSDRNKQTNRVSAAEDAIIFELGEDDKIIYWREYIEKVDVNE